MKNTYSIKTSFEFAIISDTVDPDTITKKLGLVPDRFFRKGERYISKHSKNKPVRPHNLWEIHTIPKCKETDDLLVHFEYLKSKLEKKKEVLIQMKQDTSLELIFSLSVEIEHSDFTFDLTEENILFINTVANRASFWIRKKKGKI